MTNDNKKYLSELSRLTDAVTLLANVDLRCQLILILLLEITDSHSERLYE